MQVPLPGHAADAGLRAVALMEAAKGVLVCLAGLGVLELLHHNVQQMGEELVSHFHLNPASRYPRIFLDAAAKVNDQKLWLFAGAAFAYASIRFVESYGLWRNRRWAKWFGAASGSIYIPIELYEMFEYATWAKGVVLMVNVGVVGYLAWSLWKFRRGRPPRPV